MDESDSSIRSLMQTMDYGLAPESTKQAQAWLDAHERCFGHYINGRFVDPADGNIISVINPADESPLSDVAHGTDSDIKIAVDAANTAYAGWSATDGHERARYLYAIARHIQKHARLLSVLESLDNGKPIRESRDGDIPLVARHFYHHAGWAELAAVEFPGQRSLGVCGQIIPWNFPLLMLSWKIAPALAAGNTVVLKPAEFTPLTALAFAEICTEVGLPPGVVNIVTGDGETGESLVRHPDIAKIAFTGSTEVGRRIREVTAGSGKKLSLELGGKSPFVVFEDSDLDAAVEGVVNSTWFNQGEVCCAGSRILVQEGIAETFHQKLLRRMNTLRVGDPLDKSTDVGAIVNRDQLQRIGMLVDKGVDEGANCHQPSTAIPSTGIYYPPTLVTNVDTASLLVREEIFGPVVTSSSFRTPDEAIELANDTRYGLAASVWSENISRALEVAAAIKAGVIWVNTANQFDAAAGFGGYRESGYGREGGREGMHEYLAPEHEAESDPVISASPIAAPAEQQVFDSAIDRTFKLYIGGKQKRPDSGYSYSVYDAKGRSLGLAPLGNRKDVRDAVAAARKAGDWTARTGHARAQVVYYLGENLAARESEFVELLRTHTGKSRSNAQAEVSLCVRRLFRYAALADKVDGRVHSTIGRHVTLAMNEPWGVLGVLCPDEAPLAGLISLLAPAMVLGNRVVVIVSQTHALAASEIYHLLESSDVPAGVVNLLSGDRRELADVLAAHDDVNALWAAADSVEMAANVERASIGNLKPVWLPPRSAWEVKEHDNYGTAESELTRRALQIKNIWVPYGE